jgi:predicted ATP-dependent Lon-type protease
MRGARVKTRQRLILSVTGSPLFCCRNEQLVERGAQKAAPYIQNQYAPEELDLRKLAIRKTGGIANYKRIKDLDVALNLHNRLDPYSSRRKRLLKRAAINLVRN